MAIRILRLSAWSTFAKKSACAKQSIAVAR